jgi:hypothetical protein
MIYDSFILTFKDNTDPCITMQGGKIVPAQWLHDITKGKAEFVCKAKDGIEISMPIEVFLAVKDDRFFQSKCSTLIRLRTSKVRTFLHALCYPVSHIDNRLPLTP